MEKFDYTPNSHKFKNEQKERQPAERAAVCKERQKGDC